MITEENRSEEKNNLLVHLICSSSRALASSWLPLLPACYSVLERGFGFGDAGGIAAAIGHDGGSPADLAAAGPSAAGLSTDRCCWALSSDAELDDTQLTALVVGLWRCCAAYGITEPPLDALFLLLSQASNPQPQPQA